MFYRLVKQVAERGGVTEQCKATDQMAWVGAMNNIRNKAKEIVFANFITTKRAASIYADRYSPFFV